MQGFSFPSEKGSISATIKPLFKLTETASSRFLSVTDVGLLISHNTSEVLKT